MNLRELAQLEAVLKCVYETVGARLKTVRADVQAAIDDADRTTGVRQVAADLTDGVNVAKISLTAPGPEATVTDARALTEWVKDTHPDEIERRMVVDVRPAFLAKLLDAATECGSACDPVTGEVVPGIELTDRKRTHSLRYARHGRERVAQALRTGELAHLIWPPDANPGQPTDMP
ncbi:hypothetical protein OG216_47525 (plasmid) [Streptomycetaceae bacterium NBC_01309]